MYGGSIRGVRNDQSRSFWRSIISYYVFKKSTSSKNFGHLISTVKIGDRCASKFVYEWNHIVKINQRNWFFAYKIFNHDHLKMVGSDHHLTFLTPTRNFITLINWESSHKNKTVIYLSYTNQLKSITYIVVVVMVDRNTLVIKRSWKKKE